MALWKQWTDFNTSVKLKDCLWFQHQDTYTLKVLGKDLNGAAGGNEGTGTIVIKIKDVNDNVPTLEKEEVALFDTRPSIYL